MTLRRATEEANKQSHMQSHLLKDNYYSKAQVDMSSKDDDFRPKELTPPFQ